MDGMKKARSGLSLSHMGFSVSDMARVEDFYSRVLEFP
ncbi:catechol 2,3-dioxygenase-like lactoylglutathione lyase family enzyme [Paraburkholderia atlantica]|uniref:Catechol 2,3-dioxygenase-like lactoylglutathione lyase family enzyme n=1 Tax=Paraburkholderia atlantica TaxID=2654982 RepID=A0A7W8UZH0_PARAM|nr:catechol 2,3-dioxygenase-like lactoylglutathione lyase family enzyme [Paraburkholderia atlantica]MBB5426066.1 catechol 2,3-dioxygenase-like lactoylglutathione lyase family enzyme [Paraburkholderia atlantica]